MNSNKFIEINTDRLDYLLNIYGISRSDLLNKISFNLKKKKVESEIFGNQISIANLKKTDKIFGKGLYFYTDPCVPSQDEKASIFFRKNDFNVDLNFADRWRINKIEDEVKSLQSIMSLSGYKIKRSLKTYKLQNNPFDVAIEVRKKIQIEKSVDDKEFLNQFISQLAQQNIVVYEFIEQHNLKNKTNFEGLYLKPNIIAIKRQQYALKKEIFTLAHELGHYLLNKEEIDQNAYENQVINPSLKQFENWCNHFAFYFLVGEEAKNLFQYFAKQQDIANPTILDLSQNRKISRLAIYTHLLYSEKISQDIYIQLKSSLADEYKKNTLVRKQQNENRKQLAKEQGNKLSGGVAKPINSPLVKDIYRHAYLNGTVEEIDVLNQFKPNKQQIANDYFDKLIYG